VSKLVPSVVAQRIVVKFLTNENVKSAEILKSLREQFDDETLSRIEVYDWSKSFKEGRTEIENLRRLHPLQGNLWQNDFWVSQGILFTNFLTE
jgi:hypothetical protein